MERFPGDRNQFFVYHSKDFQVSAGYTVILHIVLYYVLMFLDWKKTITIGLQMPQVAIFRGTIC
jgi:hypothetical protein